MTRPHPRAPRRSHPSHAGRCPRRIYLGGTLVLTAAATLAVAAALPTRAAAQDSPAVDPDRFSDMSWRMIGPYRGGRSVAGAGVVSDPRTYYMGTVGGGVWKTTDAGISWDNVSGHQLATSSVGAIAVSESDPNVVYVGMGEHPIRGVMTSHGDGVYRSTDGGESWKHLGLDRTRAISRIRIHPTNPDLVYVAAQGSPYGANEERGIYRSEDGGTTWDKVLYVDRNTGASDLSMDMANPRILYAAFWEHRRLPWQVQSGGEGSGFFKSTDGGDTWRRIESGLPDLMGKTSIDVSRADPRRVFAIVEADPGGGVYRSDNGGSSWTLTSDNWSARARAWYYMEIFADPQDRETVYVLNAPMMRSIDGGQTFTNVRVPHGDTHDLWINPTDNRVMINNNDGGANVSFNAGDSWSTQSNQPTAQFYRVAVDNRFPYYVYGGQQDNSSVAIASMGSGGITEKDWYDVGGCESAYTAFDPDNPRFVYAGCYMGIISEYDHHTGSARDVGVYPVMPAALQGREMKYRYNWNAPIVADPFDPSVIYHASNHLVRTDDRGITWTEISPDLTRDEDAKQGYGGGPITNEGAGGEIYGTIYYVELSPHERGVIWTGSDDGLIQLTRDGGQNWTDVTPGWMKDGQINAIEVSPHDPATAYVAYTRYKFNDLTPHVLITTDYGRSWTDRTEGIAPEAWTKVIREDPVRPGLLYLGSETGMYVSWDQGRHWQTLELGLPDTPINDLVVQERENDLVAATSGRSFWILDDLEPLQQAGMVEEEDPYLYAPHAAYRLAGGGGFGGGPGVGQNPPSGAVIDFFIPEGMLEMSGAGAGAGMSGTADRGAGDRAVGAASGTEGRSLAADTLSGAALPSAERPSAFLGASADAAGDDDPVPADTVTVEILDAAGMVVRTYSTHPDEDTSPEARPMGVSEGHNRMAWDLRHERIPNIPGAYVFGSLAGRRVVPGTYQVRLTTPAGVLTRPLEVRMDPRVDATMAEYQEQDAFVAQVASELTAIHRAAIDVDDVEGQIDALVERIADRAGAADVVDVAKALSTDLDAVSDSLYQARVVDGQTVINFPSRLKFQYVILHGNAAEADAAVTRGSRDVLRDLDVRWAVHRATVQELLGRRLDELNRMLAERGLGGIIPPERERTIS